MPGNPADIIARLWAVLPNRWFAEKSPNLNSLLTGIAAPWVWLYNLITYVSIQTRVATATDGWLDLISDDFFGPSLRRQSDEKDFTFRARIRSAMLREAATRPAVTSGLEDLIGDQPIIFEPANCGDTGSYSVLAQVGNRPSMGMAYGQAGAWGSLSLPMQFFVTALRPATAGIGLLAGYGTPNAGYGEGPLSYIDLSLLPGHVSDVEIQKTLSSLLPVNTVAWLRII